MKNWEFYEKELKKYNLAFALKNNKIYSCAKVSCGKCAFNMGASRTCDAAKVKWLYQEHKEPIVLTEDEKALCNILRTGFIARNKDGRLFWFQHKPTHKSESKWFTISGNRAILNTAFPYCKFDFIKWEDEEPWEVKVND